MKSKIASSDLGSSRVSSMLPLLSHPSNQGPLYFVVKKVSGVITTRSHRGGGSGECRVGKFLICFLF